MIPCITKSTVKFLYNTADERYNFSKSFFRKTHFPQTLNRYYKNRLIEKVSEDSLLEELEEEHSFGNRVYIIYGSTGSGKSELLCWVKDKWKIKQINRPIIRISRSELNPQILIKKCYESLGMDLKDLIIDENRWDLLLNKPISIINQLVWSSLNNIFDTDEDIVPVAMLLRPVIEKNILEFTNQIKTGTIKKPLEIISFEEFKSLLETTTISITVNYQKVRQSLLTTLDEYLFQGVEIKTIFKNLSEKISLKNIRPVLLIDDLVQSMNLYANDILDFFITLEEGNWDVVIGLTPGVLEGSEYERELKNRINNLDTIDDRVKKLWLSDESGHTFYSLNKKQATEYIFQYLKAIKEVNGFHCSFDCSNYKSCSILLENSNMIYLPFNEHLINRIFEALPEGKGALRYLIIHMKEFLYFFLDGKAKKLDKMKPFFWRDVYADHHDPLIKLLTEMYADPKKNEYYLSSEILSHFNKQSEDTLIKIKKLHYENEDFYNANTLETKQKNQPLSNIRDWVEGKKINAQLLESVRFGVGTIVHEMVKGTAVVRENTSRVIKNAPTIQRAEVINRLKYPISIDEEKKGIISIEKNINLLVVSDFPKLKMQERADAFLKITNDFNLSKWIYQTEELKEEWRTEIEGSLGFTMEEYSCYFKHFIQEIYNIGQIEWTNSIENPINKYHLEIVENLFLDWFALRDNIVDIVKLESFKGYSKFEAYFLLFNPPKELNKFQISNIPLQTFILNLQKQIKIYIENIAQIAKEKINEINLIMRLIKSVPLELENLFENMNKINDISLKEIKLINDIVYWISQEENIDVINKLQKEQQNLLNINKFLGNSSNQITNLCDLENYLTNILKVRPQVKKHIMKLVEYGETKLPKKHWKGIIRNIEEIKPDFFEHINLKLYISNKE